MARVVRGRIFGVPNKDRKFGAALNYNYVSVQDARPDKNRNIETRDDDGQTFNYTLPREYDLLFTDDEIAIARSRALKNQEDLLEKSFLSDLTDDM